MDDPLSVPPASDEEIVRLRAELARARGTQGLFHSILDNSPFLISTKDLHGIVTLANRRFEVLDGPSPEEFVGKSVFELFPPDVAAALWANDRAAASDNRPIYVEETVAHRDKSLHTYFTVKFPIHDDDGVLTGTCAVSVDITELKQAQTDSITDELTGLWNRRYFNMRFTEEYLRARRMGDVLNIAMIDIDNFKAFNDHYGHVRGDEVLAAVATALKRTLSRPGDLAFRVGGEEFLALYPTHAATDAYAIAEQLRQAVHDLALVHSHNPPHGRVTVSIGLASVAPCAETSQQALYATADLALYRAKSAGRNTVLPRPGDPALS